MKNFNELQMSKDLISFPSVTPIDAGAINYISKKLQQLGFDCKILEFKDKKNPKIKNLYARLGKKQPNLCYAGHTDVVPPGNMDDWTVNPFKPKVKKPKSKRKKYEQTLKDKLGGYLIFGVLAAILILIIIGFVTVIKWLF